MLISLFDGELIALSLKVKFSTITPPVAFPVIVTEPLVVFVVIVVPSICILSASNTPVTFVWSPDVFPKLMFPLAKIFPVAVISPSAVILPVTLRPSLILTIEESSALIDVPPNLIPLAVTPPVTVTPELVVSSFLLLLKNNSTAPSLTHLIICSVAPPTAPAFKLNIAPLLSTYCT